MKALLPFTSLNGATTAPSTGTAKDLEGAFSKHTFRAVETGGQSHSDINFYLQGSHDNINWVNLASTTLTINSPTGTVTVDQHLMRYVRAAIVGEVTGSFTVTAMIGSA